MNEAAEPAVRRATAEGLVDIEARATEIEKRIAARRIHSNSNVQFHLAIARASRNNVLRESLGHLRGQFREFRERTVQGIPPLYGPSPAETWSARHGARAVEAAHAPSDERPLPNRSTRPVKRASRGPHGGPWPPPGVPAWRPARRAWAHRDARTGR